MPGSVAMKPGDVVKAMNGKTIMIQSTNCGGRLAVADTLCYSQTYWPRFIVNIGTMCDHSLNAVGAGCTTAWSNSEALYEYVLAASMHTGDRIWRMPLWRHFTELMIDHHNVDVKSLGRNTKGWGEPCRVAAFLREFVPCGDWLHLDNRGVIYTGGGSWTYLREGMTGRPTRTLVEFLSQLVCHRHDVQECPESPITTVQTNQ